MEIKVTIARVQGTGCEEYELTDIKGSIYQVTSQQINEYLTDDYLFNVLCAFDDYKATILAITNSKIALEVDDSDYSEDGVAYYEKVTIRCIHTCSTFAHLAETILATKLL